MLETSDCDPPEIWHIIFSLSELHLLNMILDTVYLTALYI